MAADTTQTTVARIFCPHCEQHSLADHVADDVTLGIAFKVYCCFGCEELVTTTEPSDSLTPDAYVDLCWANPAGAHLWRIDRDGNYVPAGGMV